MKTELFAIILTLFATSAIAQNTCDPDVSPNQCTLEQAYDFYRDAARRAAGTNLAADEVTNTNRAIEVPDAFAGRVHNTYQDFLNLFGFAINKVDESDDGQALTIRFNPFRTGLIAAGGNLTVAKPEISEALQEDLPETGRTDLLARLQKQMGDVDNLTWSASAALQSVKCEVDGKKRCYGRQPETYRNLISIAIVPLLRKAPLPDTTEAMLALAEIATPAANAMMGGFFKAPLETGTTNRDTARNRLKELAELQAASMAKNKEFFDDAGLEHIATLVDNQPQATLTATYNAPGRYGGPEGTTYALELQYGNDNLNTIRRECDGDETCLQREFLERLDKGASSMKWVFSAAYKRNNKWTVPDLGEGETVEEFDGFTLDRHTELSVKAQGGFKLGAEVGGENMRMDFSLEGQRIEVADKRTKNRWVAAGTFTVPIGEQMSVPLTVNWANKSEFLPEDSQKLGMHIGITYRIPDMGLFGKK